jgi:hypothetical protein
MQITRAVSIVEPPLDMVRGKCSWKAACTPRVKAGFGALSGISVLPSGDVCAVGSYGKQYESVGQDTRPLIERYGSS